MKLRTKIIIFFGSFLFLVTLGIFLYTHYVVGYAIKKQINDNFSIIADQSESTYIVFKEIMKTRSLDWSSDTNIQNIAMAILAAREGTPLRARLADEFSAYLNEKKLPYDKTVFFVDIFEQN